MTEHCTYYLLGKAGLKLSTGIRSASKADAGIELPNTVEVEVQLLAFSLGFC